MFKRLAMLLILLIVLIGCNNNNYIEETTMICEINNIQSVGIQVAGNRTVILEAVGDHVVRMDEINRIDVDMFSALLSMDKQELLGLWKEDAEFVREVIMSSTETSAEEATSELLDITDTYFIFRIVSNFAEAAPEVLEQVVGRPVNFISLSEKIENIETLDGGVCTQQ